MLECVDARVRRCLMLGLRRLTGRERERAASRYSSVPADAARRVFGVRVPECWIANHAMSR